MGRIDSHAYGFNGFDVFEDTNTYTAGAGSHTDVEAWGPLVVMGEGTVQFSSACVMANGSAKPSTTKVYAPGDIIGGFFTTVKFTTAGLVHGQKVKELQDF